MDRPAAADALWERIAGLVDDLEPTDWSRPTPCAGWSVQDLVGHLSGVQVGFDQGRQAPAPEGWEPDPALSPLDRWTERAVAARRSWSADALRDELEDARRGHVARLRTVPDWTAQTLGPVGRTTEDGLFRVRMFDLWVHLQDLRRALGLPLEPEDTSAAAAAAHGYVVELAPWMWGKRAGAPEGAVLGLSLGPPLDLDTALEVRDRRARFAPEASPAGSVVEGSPAGLTLLAAGRLAPEELLTRGLLRWAGEEGERFVAGARLF